ncbi:MAG: YkvA family protein [Gammaproteobacteria bacterium]|nr:YkvA family protein [Gammaproteobacteria bacterium]MCY4199438.1 YkvA family protein [Gammaproteobacteria bacterium]MCY4278047.1 YkvA family protein [Gammaproteobacteria bacterium]MCY4322594.1 YkvA family protein [Gammaproteobacteria bacterium]
MTIEVSFELEEPDLEYFREHIRSACEEVEGLGETEIIEKADALLSQITGSEVPEFVRERFQRLRILIGMLADAEWALEDEDRQNVLDALAYFANPHDLIPDGVPVLGFIDDAIMVELVSQGLKHEIEAYNDFCAYRASEAARNREGSLETYLAARRRALHTRMRRRRTSTRKRVGRSARTRLRLF